MRKVFRDYSVLLVSSRLTMGIYEDMLRPCGFKIIETFHDDQKALGMIKRNKYNLVVTSRSLVVFSGAQLLSAVRDDKATENCPFIIIGEREDLKPGGLADQVHKVKLARFVALPMNAHDFEQIVEELLDPLIDPNREKAYGLMDEAAEKSAGGALVEAADLYTQALEMYKNHEGAWLQLGAVQGQLGKFEEAEAAYFQALRLNNYSLLAYFGLAELYEQRQDFEQTIGILRQALGVAQLMKVSSKSVSRINYFIGEFELRLKRLTGAEQSFNKAIEIAPDDAELRSDIGDAYAEKAYWAESEAHYRAAMEIDPNLAHVFNKLGIAYRRQGKYEKALKLYDNARLHRPEDEHLLFNIARAHFEAEHRDDAEKILEEALLISPEFKEANSFISKLRSLTMPELHTAPIKNDPV
jgi:tetratricopeptide (TPR) repeat protein